MEELSAAWVKLPRMAVLDLVAQGATTTRKELAVAYGGSAYGGGIVPANESKKIFVFSDPAKGEKFDYTFDGWTEDDDHGTLYLYTGAGQAGDQKLTDRNRSLLRHPEQAREVHLFVADGHVPDSDTARQRYIGEVVVDPVKPYEDQWTGENGTTGRRMVVFRFRPAPGTSLALTEKDRLRPALTTTVLPVPASTPEPEGHTAVAVPGEKHTAEEAVATITTGTRLMKRREGQLVTAFADHLKAAGHDCHGWRIRPEGERFTLAIDLYDATDKVLYEAKGNSGREAVRMAIGQLLDYRRHLNVPGLRSAVLLPSEPSADLRALLHTENIALVVRKDDGFAGFPLPK